MDNLRRQPSLDQTLTLDKGYDGRRSARLACTRFIAGGPATHAMLCQMGVPVRRGGQYRLSFWARGEGIGQETVSVALSDTSDWSNCGLQDAVTPSAEWTRFEVLFHATRDCAEKSRLQFWFCSTGTLWLDDVTLEETDGEPFRPGHVIQAAGHKNLIPNAGFMCGADGWGSAEWDAAMHWGGRMNQLFGEVDFNQPRRERRAALKVDLRPQQRPVSFFDYYDLHRNTIQQPLVANERYLEVAPGQPYTFSAYMMTTTRPRFARLAVRQFDGRSFDKSVEVTGRSWTTLNASSPRAAWRSSMRSMSIIIRACVRRSSSKDCWSGSTP